MIRLAFCSLLWLPALVGLGTLWGHRLPRAVAAPVLGLLGLTTLAAAGMVVNLVLPVSPWLAAATCAGGWALLALRARRLELRPPWPELAAVAVLALLVAWLTPPAWEHYDTGLYHLQAVKWAVQARALPGLSLVHHRFGTTLAWPPACALLELPFVGEGGSAAFATALPLVLGAWAAIAAARAARDARDLFLAGAFALLPFAGVATFHDLGGLGNDLLVATMEGLCLALWARAFAVPEERGRLAPAAMHVATFALVVKLTAGAIFAGSALLLAWSWRILPRAARWKLAGPALLVALWLVRGFLSSGCLVFSVTSTCLDVPWAVPAAVIEDASRWNRAWARLPNTDPALVLGRWDWLRSWLPMMASTPWVQLSAAALVAGLVVAAVRRTRPTAALLVPWGLSLAAVAFWFATAPALRFGAAPLLAAGLLPLAFALAGPLAVARLPWRVGAAVLALALLTWLPRPWLALWAETRSLPPQALVAPVPPYRLETAAGGLELAVPLQGDQCWDAPLPCTPSPDARLEWEGRWFALRPPSR